MTCFALDLAADDWAVAKVLAGGTIVDRRRGVPRRRMKVRPDRPALGLTAAAVRDYRRARSRWRAMLKPAG